MMERIPELKNETKVLRQMLRSTHVLHERLVDIKNKSTEADTAAYDDSIGNLKESISQLENLLFLYECGNRFDDEFSKITTVVRRHIQTARETLSQEAPFTSSSPLHFPTKPRE